MKSGLEARIAMITPGTGPCGICDYAARLEGAYSGTLHIIREPLFEALGYDVVHVQYEPSLFRQGRSTFFPEVMRKNQERKRVVTVHEAYEVNPFIAPRPVDGGLIQSLKQRLYDHRHQLENQEIAFARHNFFADVVVVHTKQAKSVLTRQGCNPEKILVLPHPVFGHPAEKQPPLGWVDVPSGRKLLLWFGFISPAVDFDALLGAMKLLKDRCFLILAGGFRRTEDRTLEHQVDERIVREGLSDSVRHIGFVPEECLSFLFEKADVFVSCPKFKTASGSLAHALAEALPSVAPDLPHVREINAEVNCVRAYVPGEAGSLAENITLLLDSETHAEYRRRLRDYADYHTLRRFAEDHAAIYRRLLEEDSH